MVRCHRYTNNIIYIYIYITPWSIRTEEATPLLDLPYKQPNHSQIKQVHTQARPVYRDVLAPACCRACSAETKPANNL